MTTVGVGRAQYPRIEVLAARAWWLARFLLGLTLEALRDLWRVLVWFRGLPRENQGVITCAVLAGLAAFQAAAGYLADSRSWVEILTTIAQAVVAGVLLYLGVVAWNLRTRTVDRSVGGKMTARTTITGATEITGHFAPPPGKPKYRQKVIDHEVGHALAAWGVGGWVKGARVHADGSGWCRARLPRRSDREMLVNYGAFMVGGECAVHSTEGCSHDHRERDWALGQLPAEDRGAAKREMYQVARDSQHKNAGPASAMRKKLAETGRWGA